MRPSIYRSQVAPTEPLKDNPDVKITHEPRVVDGGPSIRVGETFAAGQVLVSKEGAIQLHVDAAGSIVLQKVGKYIFLHTKVQSISCRQTKHVGPCCTDPDTDGY